MLRAEQLALIQEANQQLLNIRELELDYFVQCFSEYVISSTAYVFNECVALERKVH